MSCKIVFCSCQKVFLLRLLINRLINRSGRETGEYFCQCTKSIGRKDLREKNLSSLLCNPPSPLQYTIVHHLGGGGRWCMGGRGQMDFKPLDPDNGDADTWAWFIYPIPWGCKGVMWVVVEVGGGGGGGGVMHHFPAFLYFTVHKTQQFQTTQLQAIISPWSIWFLKKEHWFNKRKNLMKCEVTINVGLFYPA
jgi:hypothetical protein